MSSQRIKNALISVFHKEGLEPIVERLKAQGVTIHSTGGTQRAIEAMGAPVQAVEDLTGYPSILGGRVKTLHPKVFGGILGRREMDSDIAEMTQYEIPPMDLVIVDLYPFEDTVASGAEHQDIIEKIDIGGISLIRAAAKNYHNVLIVSHRGQYAALDHLLEQGGGTTTIEDRKGFAAEAFRVSAHYDTAIQTYLGESPTGVTVGQGRPLRYGENPHQKARFHGDMDALFEKLHGKDLSYNNLLDVDAAVNLIAEFKDSAPTFAILKHNNACGLATRSSLVEAYDAALAGDPVSAFGGILIANRPMDAATASKVHELFCEVVIAPDFEPSSLDILKGKKNRILLRQKETPMPQDAWRSALNGFLWQEKDGHTDAQDDISTVTKERPTEAQIDDLLFASKLAKHTKSNTIVLAKDGQLLASGTGQTSRVDALNQAVEKAGRMGFSLEGAVMASDAFFPFPDCVEIAHKAGVQAVIQPGGSIRDKESIEYCDEHGLAMVTTGIRHFKH